MTDKTKTGVVLTKRGITHGDDRYPHGTEITLPANQFDDWEKVGIVGPKDSAEAKAAAADKKTPKAPDTPPA